MPQKAEGIEFLPNRLNAEPIILFGISQSELQFILLSSALVWIPSCLLLGWIVGTIMGGLVLGISLCFLSVYLGAKKMQKIKRSKPEGAYVHQMAIWLHKKGIKRCKYVRYEGVWSIGRFRE